MCITKRGLAAAGLFAGCVASGNATAEKVSLTVDSIATLPLSGRVEIQSDGSNYTGPEDGFARVNGVVNLRLEPNPTGRVRSWRVWLKSRTENGEEIHLNPRPGHLYPSGHRPTGVDRPVDVMADYAGAGAQHCNALAGRLRANAGLSNAEVFAENRTIKVGLEPAVNWDMTASGGFEGFDPSGEGADWPTLWQALHKIDVVCLAQEQEPPPHADDLLQPTLASIGYANLGLDYDDQPTECPTSVNVHGLFTGNTPGNFAVRVHGAFGGVSPALQLTMGPAQFNGTHYVTTLNESLTVGAPLMDGGGDAAPGVEGQHADDLAEPPREDPDIRPIDPGNSAADGYTEGAGNPREHEDALWIEILEAGLGSVERSNHASYRILCAPGERPGGSSPGSTNVLHDDPRPDGHGQTVGGGQTVGAGQAIRD